MLTVDEVIGWRDQMRRPEARSMAREVMADRIIQLCNAFLQIDKQKLQPGQLPLTPRERKIKKFILAYMADGSPSPSYDVICEALGLKSRGHLSGRIKSMIEKGHLRKHPIIHRSIEVI